MLLLNIHLSPNVYVCDIVFFNLHIYNNQKVKIYSFVSCRKIYDENESDDDGDNEEVTYRENQHFHAQCHTCCMKTIIIVGFSSCLFSFMIVYSMCMYECICVGVFILNMFNCCICFVTFIQKHTYTRIEIQCKIYIHTLKYCYYIFINVHILNKRKFPSIHDICISLFHLL